MTKPDSMLQAARKVQEAAQIAPARFAATYKQLMDADYLPRSTGRRVWKAFPLGAAHLLIGLADAAGDALRACEMYSNNRRSMDQGFELIFGDKLAWLLASPKNSENLGFVELRADTGESIIHWNDGSQEVFLPLDDEITPSLITIRSVISGDLIRKIASSINWDNVRGSSPLMDNEDATEEVGVA